MTKKLPATPRRPVGVPTTQSVSGQARDYFVLGIVRNAGIGLVLVVLSEMLAGGLAEAFEANPDVQVLRRGRSSSGIVRDDYYDWRKALRDMLASNEKVTHVVMMLGSNDRQQFGQRIGDFQLVQQMLADSVIEINAARWMVYHAAWMLDQGMDAREQIAMVKVHAAETLGRVVDRAVQVFGGMGFCKELSIERYYRDARIYRIFDGTSEIHRGVIAKSAMKKGPVLFDVNR